MKRTVVLQETEGELFKRKSQWSEGYASFMEKWSRVINFFTLWKTSIQRVEGKHGEQLASTSKANSVFLTPCCINFWTRRSLRHVTNFWSICQRPVCAADS